MSVRSQSVPATVRLATVDDAPRVAELSGQLGYPTTPEEAAQRLRLLNSDPQHAIFLAELPPGRVVGWLHVHEARVLMADRAAEVSGLVVEDGYRSRGVGRVLLHHAEQWARSRGCLAVILRSNVIRTRAHAFYEKLGYGVIKTQKVFRKAL